MTRIRVFLVPMPRLLHDIVTSAIDAQPDMELAVLHDDCEALAGAVARGDRSVVLLSVTNDGRRAVLYELRPYEVPPGGVTPQGIVDLIRARIAEAN